MLRRALAWLWDTLRHPQHWRDWWLDWRCLRSFTSRRALDERLRAQQQRVDAMFRVMREVTEAAGYADCTGPLDEQPEPGAKVRPADLGRHLHLVRLTA